MTTNEAGAPLLRGVAGGRLRGSRGRGRPGPRGAAVHGG